MSGEKVLVCDDDKINLDFCMEVLEREGYQVKGVTSGKEAIALAQKEHFDLLLTDFVMSDINGLEIFKAIREFDTEIIGVIISGYGSFSTALDAINSGFKGFIIKPFTDGELALAVSETLKRSKLEKETITYKQTTKLKDDFLTLISHELRTPLSLVLSSANFLFGMRHEKAGEEEKKILSILKKESKRLAKIITNLLVMSGLDYTETKHRRSLINLRDITEETIDAVRENAEEKEITIHNLIPEDIPDVWGVKSKIIQLMINLLENAVKFNQRGGKVVITARKSEDHLQVAIEDTGAGIRKDEMNTIFTPFHTLEDLLSRNVEGMGLGLPVSKKIIEDHRGEIWIESTEKGSRVVFTLPYSIRRRKT
jgi:signal transduction histidine kinase